MARTQQARRPTPDQMTLDDWAEMLSADRQTADAPHERSLDAPTSRVATERTGEARDPNGAGDRRAAQHHPAPTGLLAMPEALLTRTHLRELGLERRAVDAVFRMLPVVALPGYSRPMVRVEDYLELVQHNTFRDDRVRPSGRGS